MHTSLAQVGGWVDVATGATIGYPSAGTSTKVLFGFNIPPSTTKYTNGASENTDQVVTRLQGDYGDFDYGKVFHTGIPSTWDSTWEGHGPFKHVIFCMTWTMGTIASGANDTALTALANAVPTGYHVMLCNNEIDNQISGSTNWANYVADMNHLHDLLAGLTLTGKQVEVWDCFMEFSLEPSATQPWSTTWTNPAKRHGIVWDVYWNTATSDTTGVTKTGRMVSAMQTLGMTRWCIGETGDRRQEDAHTPSANLGQTSETSDAHRATLLTARMNALKTAAIPPEGVCYFDVIGTTGDHRILTPPIASDTATKTVLANLIVASRS